MQQRTRLALLFFVILIVCPGVRAAETLAEVRGRPGPGKFFVATNGNDSWSGTRPSPNWRKSDGPFASMPRALQAARDFKRQSAKPSASAAAIFVRGGSYYLDKPLVLTPEDSGLNIVAYQQEKPVLSGGRLAAGWREVQAGGRRLWAAEVPGVRESKWYFRELWVNGERAVRARHPDRGYLKIAELPDQTADWFQGHQRFRFAEGDLKQAQGLNDAEVMVMNRWVESRLPVKSIDEQQRVVTFTKRSVFQLAAGDLYYLEGAMDALDQPGEWCLDRANATLYYMPRPGEALNKIQAVAPVLGQVLRCEGRPAEGRFIENVALRGLVFSHAEWCFPSGFESQEGKPVVDPAPKADVGGFAQAAIGVPGAVWGEGVRHCLFENCSFKDLGTYGLELGRGCAANRILRCEFSDLGAGGIKIGETAIRHSEPERTAGNEIDGCLIHDGGKMFHSAIGVWIGQSPNNRLTHNLIYDFFYTGISIGWTWGYSEALATNNLVAFNHIHHVGAKSDGDGPILSDMGGIYTLGMQPGTSIHNNLWHDIAGLQYGGWGIYFDEGSSSIVARSNIVYRTTHGGFHQHYGATNVVENNIFAFARDQQIQRSRPEAHISFSFTTNIVFFDHGTLLGSSWSDDKFITDWNLFWDARPDANAAGMRFAGATLDAWRARGHDVHSVIEDPLFVAPSENDFRLRPDSPAYKLGFKAIDLRQAGIPDLKPKK
jgi:glycosyl hydrolase family 141/parallel beta helix pectate lyase-like protein